MPCGSSQTSIRGRLDSPGPQSRAHRRVTVQKHTNACRVRTRWRSLMRTWRKTVRHNVLVRCICNSSITRIRSIRAVTGAGRWAIARPVGGGSMAQDTQGLADYR